MSKSSKIVICLISSIFALFLAIVPLFVSNNKVYADESSRIDYYDFQSSNIFIPILNDIPADNLSFTWRLNAVSDPSETADSLKNQLYLFLDLKIDGTALLFDVEHTVYYRPDLESSTETDIYFYNDCNLSTPIKIFDSEDYPSEIEQSLDIYIQNNELFFSREPISIYLSSGDVFSKPLVGVDFLNQTTSSYTLNNLSYFNSNFDRIEFLFYSDEVLSARRYYFVSDFQADYDAVFNEGYNVGLKDGSDAFYDKGFQDGLNDFDNNQLNFDRGYAKGLEDSNGLSFFSLLSAVVDVPVQTLYGLLDFNFLGFNLLQFFGGILALAVFIMIIRFIIG